MQSDDVAVPFEAFMADLRGRGFGIGLNEYKDVAKLVARLKGEDPQILRNAIAAVVARNADEIDRIRKAFDEWVQSTTPKPPVPDPPPPRPPRTWRMWVLVALALVALSAGAAAAWRYFHRQHDAAPKENRVAPPPAEPATSDQPSYPAPSLPDPPRKSAAELPWIAAAIGALVALLALSAREARGRQENWFRRYWRDVLAREPGPHHYEPNVRRTAPPLARSVIEEVASILGRAPEIDPADGETLDVEESLRQTLRAGLAPHLKFKPPPGNVPVLILQDVSWQMRPWAAKVEYFVRELKRQGVYVEQWYFSGDPLIVSRTPEGRRVDLATLAATRSAASVLVLSSGQGLKSFDAFARLLRKWTYRTWIHPIGNPQYWRRDLESLPIRIWPMTRAGVHAAAVEISRRGETGIVPRTKGARAVTAGDVERMKQLLALTPHPTLELAEELRRRFAPEVPEEVVLFLGAEGVFYGETIALPQEQLARLLAAAALDPEREQNVRRFLLEVLRESRPPEDSAAHLRWQLDEAVQRLELDARDEDAAQTVRKLAEGPLRDEVRAAGFDVAAPKTLPKTPAASLGERPPSWAWPRLRAAALAIVVIVPLLLLVARVAAVGKGDPIPHVVGAYTLTFNGNETLVATANRADVPARVTVYRDGKVFSGTPLELPLNTSGAGWYDVRVRLTQGNFATSDPVWVPGVPEWPSDDVTTRVVAIIAGVKSGPITRKTPLDVFDALKVSAAVLREFKVPVPASATTAGAVVDSVKAALAANALMASFTVRFISGKDPVPNVAYTLIGESGTVSQRSDVAVQLKPGVYSVAVGTRTFRPVILKAGEQHSETYQLPQASSWPNDDVARRLRTVIATEFGIAQEQILPSSGFENSVRLQMQGLLRRVNREFGIEMTQRDVANVMTAGQLLTAVRRAIKSAPVAVELRFTDPDGKTLTDVPFAINGSRQSSEPDGVAELRLAPGTYKVEYEGEIGLVRVPPNKATLVVHSRTEAPVKQQVAELPDYLQEMLDTTIRDTKPAQCLTGFGESALGSCGNRACVMRLAIRNAAEGNCGLAVTLLGIAECDEPKLQEALKTVTQDALCAFLKKYAASGE